MRTAKFFCFVFFLISLLGRAFAATPLESSYCVKWPRGNVSNMGSGTAVSDKWLVTCRHVVGDARKGADIEMWAQGGKVLKGQVCYGDPAADVAFIYCESGFPAFVPVAEADPKIGEPIQLFGWGPDNTLRSATGRVKALAPLVNGQIRMESTLRIQSGDSGGGAFNAAGELCGINYGADCEGYLSSGEHVVGYSCSRPASALWASSRYFETQCQGGYCPIPPRYYGGGSSLVPVQPRPVQPQPPRPVQPTQPIAPVTPARPCECDPAAIVSIKAQLDAMQKQLLAITITPGEPGTKGEPGPPGEPGAPGKSASAEEIAAAVAAKVKACQCEPVKPNESARHIVIVADQTASTWSRLKDEISRAQQAYSGIRIAAPPKFSVPLPQIVAYQDGVPVKVIQGSRSVSEALSHVARGEEVFFKE